MELPGQTPIAAAAGTAAAEPALEAAGATAGWVNTGATEAGADNDGAGAAADALALATGAAADLWWRPLTSQYPPASSAITTTPMEMRRSQ